MLDRMTRAVLEAQAAHALSNKDNPNEVKNYAKQLLQALKAGDAQAAEQHAVAMIRSGYIPPPRFLNG